jgi:mRNA interferase RelE/StbE
MNTNFSVKILPRAIKDLEKLAKSDAKKIIEKIRSLEHGLNGDIKKLTNFTPEYRLRVGDYRILFEVAEKEILIYRIKHRKEAYL